MLLYQIHFRLSVVQGEEMSVNTSYNEITNKLVEYALGSALILACLFFSYIQGVWVLNTLVSFKRTNRGFIFRPTIALVTGIICSLICLVLLNFKKIISMTFTLEALRTCCLPCVLLSAAITGIVGLFAYVIKEYTYMKGKNNER